MAGRGGLGCLALCLPWGDFWQGQAGVQQGPGAGVWAPLKARETENQTLPEGCGRRVLLWPISELLACWAARE